MKIKVRRHLRVDGQGYREHQEGLQDLGGQSTLHLRVRVNDQRLDRVERGPWGRGTFVFTKGVYYSAIVRTNIQAGSADLPEKQNKNIFVMQRVHHSK